MRRSPRIGFLPSKLGPVALSLTLGLLFAHVAARGESSGRGQEAGPEGSARMVSPPGATTSGLHANDHSPAFRSAQGAGGFKFTKTTGDAGKTGHQSTISNFSTQSAGVDKSVAVRNIFDNAEKNLGGGSSTGEQRGLVQTVQVTTPEGSGDRSRGRGDRAGGLGFADKISGDNEPKGGIKTVTLTPPGGDTGGSPPKS